ncbi:hypothetical protein HYS95_03425, partial [Candidatus Daviesbacteria bacterium]|nr:hypothetical protein [Candidatus Daviesbacteria bacterium]
MDFQKYLKSSAKQINREVERILGEELKRAEKTDKQSLRSKDLKQSPLQGRDLRSKDLKKLVPLLKAFIKSCQGGKRIRAMLVKLGYEIAIHLRGA